MSLGATRIVQRISDCGMTSYINAFHRKDNPYKSVGPEHFTTDATPVDYRGFKIYARVPTAGKFKYGEIDAVMGGVCVMISCTVDGAKTRIDNLYARNGEDRAIASLKRHGIELPPELTEAHAFQLLSRCTS